jgi:hypothetical protein
MDSVDGPPAGVALGGEGLTTPYLTNGRVTKCYTGPQTWSDLLQSTDHELIPARNASLVAMQGSASGSNRYYPT